MPDGKRNSLPPEGETEGVNGFYKDDEDIQNSNSAVKRLPLSLNTRGYHNLSERLLKTMVANEIKKTLDVQDNKKLVAHHRPVLHPENEISETDMVVVGVMLNSKQSQNDEVSKAIEMLRRNGVSCVYFTIKDQPTGNGVKKDDATTTTTISSEKDAFSEEKPKDLEQDENKSDAADKKVSSPTVSTTSDYTSPPDDVIDSIEANNDTSCTSTTVPSLTTIENLDGPKEKELADIESLVSTESEKKFDDQDIEPPTLSPSPPLLFPQESKAPEEGKCEDQLETGNTIEAPQMEKAKKVAASRTKRKKRRKRMSPYVSRKRSRNKKRKVTEDPPLEIKEEVAPEPIDEPTSISLTEPVDVPKKTTKRKLSPATDRSKVVTLTSDPYEFEESDTETQVIKTNLFKTPIARSIRKVTLPDKVIEEQSKFSTPVVSPTTNKRTAKKKKRVKGSPRKRLTFSKIRALSPDITDPGSFQPKRKNGIGKKCVDGKPDNLSPIKESTCVQPISTDKSTADITIIKPEIIETPASPLASVPSYDDNKKDIKLVSHECDADIRSKRSEALADPDEVSSCDSSKKVDNEPISSAQVAPNVQNTVHKKEKESGVKQETVQFLAPAPPNDSLQDASDSMHLRRSSFYSSISRNVRTNLEKYLDGRPQDLKAPKRSKKIKNGFLLHHGDNFPDDPEAPYRLHLATQVLLKLNKRRVKFKPKEDKGKSLLSYLKLQPKRVSRVGKHSKSNTEESETTDTTEPTSSVFSGDWTVPRKFICNICGQVENAFWDMVMHKGEVHPGIVVTHVELCDSPPEGFRNPPSPRTATTLTTPPPCSKCAVTFNSYDDLHRHIFECAGNASVLEEPSAPKVLPRKRKGKRKRGFKRRISSLPKKNTSVTTNKTPVTTPVIKSGEITKRRNSEVFKCEFCTREFKTEGWLKNHVSLSHSLPISIPLEKLSLPSRASFICSRRVASQLLAKPSKQLSRET